MSTRDRRSANTESVNYRPSPPRGRAPAPGSSADASMPDAPAGDVPPATNDKPLPPAAPGTPEPIGTGWTEIFPVYRMDQPPGQVRHTVENIDGQRRGSFQDHGSATHYFKCGLYHQPGMTPRCDAWFKNIRIFKK